MVKKETPDIKAMEDLKGKTIAVNKGSTYDLWARENSTKYGWNVESYGTTPDALQAIASGRAFAILLGNTAAAWAVKNNPMLRLSHSYSTGLVFAVPVRKDNAALRNQLELAIECMKKDGEIAKISEKVVRKQARIGFRRRLRFTPATVCLACRAMIQRRTSSPVADHRKAG